MKKPKEKRTKYKLSNSQKLLLLFQLLNRKSNAGNVCGSFTMQNKIDTIRLEKAINKFVENNEGIRTRVCFSGLGFRQYFEKYEPFKIEVIEVENDEDVKKIEKEINNEVFSILKTQLFKVKLFKYKDGRGGFVGCMHHIICDAWTVGLTLNEIMGYYTDLNAEFDTYSYSDYIESEKNYLKSDRMNKDKKYWKELIEAGLPPQAMIEGDLNREDKQRKCGNCLYTIEKNIIDKIDKYCASINISQCSFFTGVYSLFIGKEANLNKFMLDTILSNRTNYKEKHTVGLFAKTVGMVAKIENTSFEEYIKNIHRELAITYKHYKYPTKNILKKLHKLEPKRKRLSKIWFSFQNAKTDKQKKFQYSTRWTPLETTYLYDMLIELYDLNNDGSLNIIYYYILSKYSKDRIDYINASICNIINQILENKEIRIEDLKIEKEVQLKNT